MLQGRIEPGRIDTFDAVLGRCALQPDDTSAILRESQSRPVRPAILRGANGHQPRIVYVSNEHPEALA